MSLYIQAFGTVLVTHPWLGLAVAVVAVVVLACGMTMLLRRVDKRYNKGWALLLALPLLTGCSGILPLIDSPDTCTTARVAVDLLCGPAVPVAQSAPVGPACGYVRLIDGDNRPREVPVAGLALRPVRSGTRVVPATGRGFTVPGSFEAVSALVASAQCP